MLQAESAYKQVAYTSLQKNDIQNANTNFICDSGAVLRRHLASMFAISDLR